MEKPSSILENFYYTTVRIVSRDKHGNQNVGTGFYCNLPKKDDPNITYPYIVTCKHVIENAIEGRIFVHKEKNGSASLGDFLNIEIVDFAKQWIKNENYDIAIFPIADMLKQYQKLDKKIFCRFIDANTTPYNQNIDKIDAVEDVLFIGYPNDIYDTKNLLPIVRKGITATPISLDFEGEPKFLIDASIFPGSSGSPVVICNIGSFLDKGGHLSAGNRVYFLGLVCSVYFSTQENEIIERVIPTNKKLSVSTTQMIDLGVVYKSSIIQNMIEDHISKIKK